MADAAADATRENWNRRTWRLAGPVMLSNISLPLLGAVDMAVVGHLPGPHYLGAVAVGALIVGVVWNVFNFLRMGTTGLTAQSLGARDPDEVRAWLLRACLMAVAIGLALIAVQTPILWAGIAAIGPSPEVRPLTDAYYSIAVWGAPAVLVNSAILGWFFGVQNTRAALVTQVIMNGVNVVLDLWFVLGLGWGVPGVASATVISQVLAVAVGLWLARRDLGRIGGRWHLASAFDLRRLARMVRVNGDIMVRSVCLQVAFIVLTGVGARMGDVVLAANAILMNFQMFMAFALDGFANAAEALTGEALGAGERGRFRQAVKATSRWALGFSACFSIFYFAAGGVLIDVLTSVPEVRAAARVYLPWTAALPMISVWSYQLDGIFIGATWTAEMRNGMAASLAVFASLLWLLVPDMANHGLWLAFTLFMATRAVTLGVFYPGLERTVGGRP